MEETMEETIEYIIRKACTNLDEPEAADKCISYLKEQWITNKSKLKMIRSNVEAWKQLELPALFKVEIEKFFKDDISNVKRFEPNTKIQTEAFPEFGIGLMQSLSRASVTTKIIKYLLSGEPNPTVALIGPPASGKSWLLEHIGRALSKQFSNVFHFFSPSETTGLNEWVDRLNNEMENTGNKAFILIDEIQLAPTHPIMYKLLKSNMNNIGVVGAGIGLVDKSFQYFKVKIPPTIVGAGAKRKLDMISAPSSPVPFACAHAAASPLYNTTQQISTPIPVVRTIAPRAYTDLPCHIHLELSEILAPEVVGWFTTKLLELDKIGINELELRALLVANEATTCAVQRTLEHLWRHTGGHMYPFVKLAEYMVTYAKLACYQGELACAS